MPYGILRPWTQSWQATQEKPSDVKGIPQSSTSVLSDMTISLSAMIGPTQAS